MGEAADDSFRFLTRGDIDAIVAYLQTVPAKTATDFPDPKTAPAPTSHKQGVAADTNPVGKRVFEGACASCHDWTGVSPLTRYATLTGSRAVNDPSAVNVAQIVLSGERRQIGNGVTGMPAFGNSLSDAEVAALANYVTARFGAVGSHMTAEDVAKLRQSTSQ
jgi:mono/diheme cytochrome c family protein